jgi:hypothetical protein
MMRAVLQVVELGQLIESMVFHPPAVMPKAPDRFAGVAASQAEIQQVMNSGISYPVPAFAPVVTVDPKSATNMIAGDSTVLTTACHGTRPLYYQRKKNGTNYPGATTDVLSVAGATASDSGSYALVITNSTGSTTSAVAQIVVSAYRSPDLTNGIVAYYPCNAIVAGRTADLVSAYDMSLYGGMGSGDLIPGKWGNALQFSSVSPIKYDTLSR